MAEDITVNGMPASRRISARRVDADARISLVGDTARREYYRAGATRAGL
jgi:hypothetical protein